MVAWDSTDVASCCLPQYPGWGSVDLSYSLTHHLPRILIKEEVDLKQLLSDLDPYPLIGVDNHDRSIVETPESHFRDCRLGSLCGRPVINPLISNS